MKKISVILFFSILSLIGYSQQDSLLKTKLGVVILPQKGDLAIGISVNPILNYIGNMLSSSGSNNFNLGLLNNNLIYGKYFLTSQSALRLKLGINEKKQHLENKVRDDLDMSGTKMVIDKNDYSYSNIDISLGYEKRKGSNRLQVSCGGELGFFINSIKNKYEYGNKFSASNANPTTTVNFNNPFSINTDHRTLENSINNGFSVGARLFTGIEYFLLPKISIGGEIGLSYEQSFISNNVTITESWDYYNSVLQIEKEEYKLNKYSINTDILNGQIFILFHF